MASIVRRPVKSFTVNILDHPDSLFIKGNLPQQFGDTTIPEEESLDSINQRISLKL